MWAGTLAAWFAEFPVADGLADVVFTVEDATAKPIKLSARDGGPGRWRVTVRGRFTASAKDGDMTGSEGTMFCAMSLGSDILPFGSFGGAILVETPPIFVIPKSSAPTGAGDAGYAGV